MRKTLMATGLMLLLLASCSKEKSLETGGAGSGNTAGALLVKIETTGVQNSTVEYTYDASKKVTSEISSSTGLQGNATSTLAFTRDAAKRVSRIKQTGTSSSGDINSQTSYFYPNATDTRPKYAMNKEDIQGFVIFDSTVFTYNGNLPARADHYFSYDDGATYELVMAYLFAFDAKGNMTSFTIQQDLGNGLEEVMATTWEYDAKTNPVNFGDLPIMLYTGSYYTSPNNPVKQTLKIADPATSIIIGVTYQYRADNKPSKATGSYSGSTFNATYTYQ